MGFSAVRSAYQPWGWSRATGLTSFRTENTGPRKRLQFAHGHTARSLRDLALEPAVLTPSPGPFQLLGPLAGTLGNPGSPSSARTKEAGCLNEPQVFPLGSPAAAQLLVCPWRQGSRATPQHPGVAGGCWPCLWPRALTQGADPGPPRAPSELRALLREVLESPALRVVLSIEREPQRQKTTQPRHTPTRGNACKNNVSVSSACCHSERQAGWEPRKCSVAKPVPKQGVVIGAAATAGCAWESLGSPRPRRACVPPLLCVPPSFSGFPVSTLEPRQGLLRTSDGVSSMSVTLPPLTIQSSSYLLSHTPVNGDYINVYINIYI